MQQGQTKRNSEYYECGYWTLLVFAVILSVVAIVLSATAHGGTQQCVETCQRTCQQATFNAASALIHTQDQMRAQRGLITT